MSDMPEDAFHSSYVGYGWDNTQLSFISSMPHYEEFIHDTQSLLLLEIAFMDRDSAISERLVALDMLRDYWSEKWDYDFDDFFDYAAWREWISGANTA